jgi:hypothetical protein
MTLQELLTRTALDLVTKGVDKNLIRVMDAGGYVEIKEEEGEDLIYAIQINPSRERPPTRSARVSEMYTKDQEWKRYVVKFISPALELAQRESLPAPYKNIRGKGIYSLFFNNSGKIKFSYKMMTDISYFQEFCKASYEEFKKLKAEEAKQNAEKNKIGSVIKDKAAMRKKQAEARSLIFDALKTAVMGFDGKIESMLEGETINLTLKNDIKIRLQAEPGGVVLSDLEFNREFDPKGMISFLHKLGQVKL